MVEFTKLLKNFFQLFLKQGEPYPISGLHLFMFVLRDKVHQWLDYKRITIVIDAPSVVSKWRSKFERHLLTIVIDDAS